MANDVVRLAVEAIDNASKTLDDIGASFDDLGKAGERASKDLGRLSERLTDLDEASVGKAAIDELGRSMDAGKITAEQYAEAVEEIQVASGLASDASVAAAGDLTNLNKSFESGEITGAQYAEGLKEITNRSEDAAEGVKGLQLPLTELNAALELAGKGVELFKQAFEFGKEGAAIQRIGEQFQATTAQFGISGDALIAELDKAAGRTVDDEELMKVATRALTQDLVSSSDELVELFKVARASAVRFGGDTAEAFEQISLATETGMVRSLKARGIVLDLEKVYKDYSSSLGKTVKELTQQEEKQARLNAVLETGAKLVEAVGDSVDDNLSKFQKFERQVGDLGDGLKTTFVDVMTPVLDRVERLRILADDSATASEKLAAAIALNQDPLSGVAGALGGVIQKLEITTREEENNKRAVDDAITSAKAYQKPLNEDGRALRELAAASRDAQTATKDLSTLVNNSRGLAIEYTRSNEDLAKIQGELSALDAEIAKRGERRIVVQQASADVTQEFAEAQARLSVAQEHLAETTQKGGESDAEFSLRMIEAQGRVTDLQGKVGELSGKMGDHAVAVGGATKAQLEQRDAYVAQIDQFQKAQEIERATQAFDALTKAFQDGTLTSGEYEQRAVKLNAVTGLYTNEALNAATAQQKLIDQLTDPASTTWSQSLNDGKAALDGVADATETVSKKTQRLSKQDLLDLGETSKREQDKSKKAAEDTGKSIEDVSGKVNKLARDDMVELKTETETTGAAVMAKFQEIADSIFRTSDRVVELRGKLEELPEVVNIQVKTTGIGGIPGTVIPPATKGFQHGLDFIVPAGFPNDSAFMPLRVSSGERVIVQPRSEQVGGQAAVNIGGDTVIINDRLALAQYYEQKRMRLLERSASRMR